MEYKDIKKKIKIMKITITFKSSLSSNEINKILEKIFYDGEYFEDFIDVDWEIKEINYE